MAKEYLIFHCAKDDDWIVCVRQGQDLALGVADCPDESTARVVLGAMRLREEIGGHEADQNAEAKADKAPA